MSVADLSVILVRLAIVAALGWYFGATQTPTDAKVKGGRQVVDVTVRVGPPEPFHSPILVIASDLAARQPAVTVPR